MNPTSAGYSPFEKRIDELVAGDLPVLGSVSEGWYVEYKSQVLSTKKLAKSLSSFANQYGGWLFLGIEGDPRTHAASAFPGLNAEEVPGALEALRNASKDALNPEVFFEAHAIHGDGNHGLANDRAVIAIRVPLGPEPPYVHSNGRIYRRVADASDPKPETDRFLLDRLWERGEKSRQRLEAFITRSPVISEAEGNLVYLHVSILSDPFEIGQHRFSSAYDAFRSIMRENPIPFDTIFTSTSGFVARQVAGNDPYLRSLTWEFDITSNSFVTIPLNSSEIPFGMWLSDYATAEPFTALLETQKLEIARVVDLNLLFDALSAVIKRHRELASKADVYGPLYAKVRLENVWRCIPFLDMPSLVNHFRENGVPVVQDDEFLVPPGTDLPSFEVLPHRNEPSEEDGAREAVGLAMLILEGFGIPRELLRAETLDFVKTGFRAREAQQRRLSRDVETLEGTDS